MSIPDGLSYTADVASLVSLLATAYLANETRKIKDTILNRTRIPEANADLSEQGLELVKAMAKWPSSENDAYAVLARVAAICASIEPRVRGKVQEDCRQISSIIRNRTSSADGWANLTPHAKQEKIWLLNAQLQMLIMGLAQLEKDFRRGA